MSLSLYESNENLKSLLNTIVQHEKVFMYGYEYHTEFNLPFEMKSNVLMLLYNYPYDQILLPYKIHYDETLWYAFSVLNRYLIKNDGLTRLFSYLCTLNNPKELLSRCAVKKYSTSDIIPLYHYDFIKECMEQDGKSICDFYSHTFHVFYMIGDVVAFVVSNGKEAVYTFIISSKSPRIDGMSILKPMIANDVSGFTQVQKKP